MHGEGGSLPWRLFTVAFVLRVAYMTLAHTYRLRVLDDHFEFGWEMGRIARALATGFGFADPFNGHSGPSAWTPPLYPLIIAAAFKLCGVYTLKAAWLILAVNSALSAATAPAVYEMAWRTFGRDARGLKIALWSGWLWVLYPAAMQYAVKWIWDMSLTAFLFAWVLVLALRLRAAGEEQRSLANGIRISVTWAGFGLLWGLIALSNSSLLAFLPACGIWIVWPMIVGRRAVFPAVRHVTLAAVCCMGVIAPWVIRNEVSLHHFIPLRDNFGAELFESVRPSNNGFPWGATVSLAEASPQYLRYKQLGEVIYSQQQGLRADALIRQNPRRFWAFVLKRIDFYWVSVPHPLDHGVLNEALREMNYAFLSVSGLLGLALALKRGVPGAWLYFWAFLLCPLVYYAVTVQARFRHPLEPIITILTVYLFQSAMPRRQALELTA